MEEKVKDTFTNHVLNFDDSSKAEMFNLAQYIVLAIIPIIALNKLIQSFVPPADESKHSVEITLELVAQLLAIFFGIFFIHRVITYIPTYSNSSYTQINLITPILTFMVVVLSIQSKIGDKANILYERVMELLGYSMRENFKPQVRKTQPISGTPMNQPSHQQTTQHVPSYDIRNDVQMNQPPPQQQPPPQENFNSPQAPMGPPPQAQHSPMQQQPQMGQMGQMGQAPMEEVPMAANEIYGGMGVAF